MKGQRCKCCVHKISSCCMEKNNGKDTDICCWCIDEGKKPFDTNNKSLEEVEREVRDRVK